MKGVEKKVFGEHKKHIALTEIEAKVAYVKTARSLSTYGVTFFLVKVFHFFFLIALPFIYQNVVPVPSSNLFLLFLFISLL